MKPSEIISKKLQIVSNIETNCKNILGIYQKTGYRLYAGIDIRRPYPKDDDELDWMELSSRTKREPRDTPENIQALIDEFLKQTGFTALRSNSSFMTGDDNFASQFGPEYIIFPFDNASFTWSKVIGDLTGYFELTDYGGLDYDFEDSPKGSLGYMLSHISAKAFVKRYQFSNKNLLNAIKSGNEIYLHGKYYAIPVEPSKIYKQLNISHKAIRVHQSHGSFFVDQLEAEGRKAQKLTNPKDIVAYAIKHMSNIKHIKNPSEEIQLAVVSQLPNAIDYIKNPSKKVIETAISKEGHLIADIKNPSIKLQLLAVNNSPRNIWYIKNPARQTQLLALTKMKEMPSEYDLEVMRSVFAYVTDPIPEVQAILKNNAK